MKRRSFVKLLMGACVAASLGAKADILNHQDFIKPSMRISPSVGLVVGDKITIAGVHDIDSEKIFTVVSVDENSVEVTPRF